MTIPSATPAAKVTKLDRAVAIYKKHQPKNLARKDFRAVVVAEFRKELGVTNLGTLGMYFGQCDQIVNIRTPKHYNITAPRKTRATVAKAKRHAAEATMSESELTALLTNHIRGTKAKTLSATPTSPISSL
jgi:hypothetical protein